MHAAMFDLMRGDRARAAPNALELTRLAREYDLNLFRAFGVFLEVVSRRSPKTMAVPAFLADWVVERRGFKLMAIAA
jgi:hypothetical protein